MYREYKVKVRTKPGMYAQYDGYIEFSSNYDLSTKEVYDMAYIQLLEAGYRHTKDMFVFGDIEII